MTMDNRMGQIIFEFNEAGSTSAEDLVLAGAREAGYTLDQLGEMFGCTREWIRLRLKRVPKNALTPDYAPSDAKKKRDDASLAAQQKRRDQRRILGLKQSAPVMNVPVATLNEIKRLHEMVTEVRGWTPLDHPNRLAIVPFGELLYGTIQKYGIPQGQMERALGQGRMTFVVWLRNHGYLKQMPSQRSYKGVLLVPKGRRKGVKTLVVGSTCVNGHLIGDGDIQDNGGGNTACRPCKRDRARRYYLAKKSRLQLVGEVA